MCGVNYGSGTGLEMTGQRNFSVNTLKGDRTKTPE